MRRRRFLQSLGAGALAAALPARAADRPPNIVFILADDMGFGDPGCYNPQSKIPTPHMDALAAAGMRFTDAHTPSAVCTPTRYAVLTGRYCWRSTLKSGVLNGYSAPLIPESRLTVAVLLKGAGYRTACVGKWHLGLGWGLTRGNIPSADSLDYAAPLTGGPCALGFDYFFGIPASLDMPPYVYVENDRVVEAATAATPGREGLGFFRAGPCAPGFRHEDVLDVLTTKAEAWLDRHAADPAAAPFFLYFPLPAPHTPILPRAPFRGRSAAGEYGDFVCETDDAIGRIAAALDRHGWTENTLFIVTNDNGCAPYAGIDALRAMGHEPNGPYRGHKADLYEGGNRVPFIVRWPGQTPAASIYPHPVGVADLMATAAQIAGRPLPADAGEDSVSLLGVFRGETGGPVHEAIVHQSSEGYFAIRRGPWKLLFCPGSGGWSHPTPKEARGMDLPPVQLYNLDGDPAETRNLHADHPAVVEELTALIASYVERGRSTPGPAQQNEGVTDFLKRGEAA